MKILSFATIAVAFFLTISSCKKEKDNFGNELSGIYQKDLSSSDLADNKKDDIIVFSLGDSLLKIERSYTKIAKYKQVLKNLVDGTVIDDILGWFGADIEDAAQWEHFIQGDYHLEYVSNKLYRGIMTENLHKGNVQGAGVLEKDFKLNEFSIIFDLNEDPEGRVSIRWNDETFKYFKQ